MSIKIRAASAMSLAATLLTVFFGAESSGAFAQDAVPGMMTEAGLAEVRVDGSLDVEAVESGETISYSSDAAVQPLPQEPAAPANPASLAELVAATSIDEPMSKDMHCLAGAIYFESKGEPLEGQLAVGRVIVNRALSGRFPSTYCGVVYQRSQFSFVRGGRMPAINTGSAAWQKAQAIARIADEGSWESPAKGALFFHARYVSPGWRLTRVAQVQNHIFYR